MAWRPLRAHGIEKPELREAIIRELIDELYGMLQRVAGDPDQTKVYLVDAAVPSTVTSGTTRSTAPMTALPQSQHVFVAHCGRH